MSSGKALKLVVANLWDNTRRRMRDRHICWNEWLCFVGAKTRNSYFLLLYCFFSGM